MLGMGFLLLGIRLFIPLDIRFIPIGIEEL